MALPGSGAISLSQVNTELGLSASATITMNDAAVRTLFGIASGTISMSNGYGKSNGLAADYLVIGGGGGAGNVNPSYYNFYAGNLGGGGGAGGYLTGSPALSGSYTITIGAGAAGAYPSNGSNSSIIGGSLSITAIGGGSGGTYGSAGKAGGSGGGGSYSGTDDSTRYPQGGARTIGQGNLGGPGDWYHYDSGDGTDDWQGGGGGGGAYNVPRFNLATHPWYANIMILPEGTKQHLKELYQAYSEKYDKGSFNGFKMVHYNLEIGGENKGGILEFEKFNDELDKFRKENHRAIIPEINEVYKWAKT
jgi:hypothetical protein